MKKFPVLVLSGALVLAVAVSVPAETVEKTTTSETTYRGTVSEINPSQIIVKSDSGSPMTYTVTNKTTYVDADGNVVTRESIANQPVTVYYSKDGDTTTVSKVQVTRGGGVTTRRETTTEERR
jgi:hypothetical protein